MGPSFGQSQLVTHVCEYSTECDSNCRGKRAGNRRKPIPLGVANVRAIDGNRLQLALRACYCVCDVVCRCACNCVCYCAGGAVLSSCRRHVANSNWRIATHAGQIGTWRRFRLDAGFDATITGKQFDSDVCVHFELIQRALHSFRMNDGTRLTRMIAGRPDCTHMYSIGGHLFHFGTINSPFTYCVCIAWAPNCCS